jgi:hypothetical protein
MMSEGFEWWVHDELAGLRPSLARAERPNEEMFDEGNDETV